MEDARKLELLKLMLARSSLSPAEQRLQLRALAGLTPSAQLRRLGQLSGMGPQEQLKRVGKLGQNAHGTVYAIAAAGTAFFFLASGQALSCRSFQFQVRQ